MLVLIADDDRLVRFSLKSMLAELPGEFTIEEAADGEEMVAQFGRLHPDIAFVDISMPNLDGIAAIERCTQLWGGARYVVLTAHADFEYAQRCITLQVSDYILKPIAPADLAAVVEKLRGEIAAEREKKLADFQYSIFSRLQQWDKAAAPPPAGQDGAAGGEYTLFTFFVDAPAASPLAARLLQALHEHENPLLAQGVYFAVAPPGTGSQRAVARAGTATGGSAVQGQMSDLCARLSGGEGIVSCLYAAGGTLPEVYAAGRAAEENPHLRFLASPGRAARFAAPQPPQAAATRFAHSLQRLLQAYKNGDDVQCRQLLQVLKKEYAGVPPGVSLARVAQVFSAVAGAPLPAGDTRSFFASLQRVPPQAAAQGALPAAGKIAKIQEYINQNYMKDISIASLAQQFGLTPNYLSALFHEKTGMRFVEYLTEVRMSQAKKILAQNGGIPVKELCRMTGYASPRHFSALFKKSTGCYPSEYGKAAVTAGTADG